MRLLILLFFLVTRACAFAQDSTVLELPDSTMASSEVTLAPIDSAAVELRSFSKSAIDELKKSGDFDYRQPPTVAESLWDRFIIWLSELINWLLNGAVTTDWGRVLLYTLAIIVMVVIVMLLLKVDALRVFYSGADKGGLNYALEENIHEMDFESLIREALEKKEYRLGVRLTFLYALKLLSDKQHIDWRPGKTNHEYMLELDRQELKTGFNELSFYFDYAWYGDFTVNQALYERVNTIFTDWRTKVS